MKKIKVAILGFGNAGRAFGKMLLNKLNQIESLYGTDVDIVAITTGSRGSLINDEGINIEKAISDLENFSKFDVNSFEYSTLNSMDVVQKVDYDVLIELTPLNIYNGQPAIDHIKGALNRSKDVITANKGPIAWAYKELKDLAFEKGSMFLFETTVMDGTPIFNLMRENLKFCEVLEVKGILNTTTNFILEELEKGKPYDLVMEEGTKRGFIEADPTMDTHGFDAAAKITALLNVLMDANITPDKIIRKGIEDIKVEDIYKAKNLNKKYKLLCHGYKKNGQVIGKVWPVIVDKSDLLSTIDGTSSLITIKTDLMGTLSIVEHDPEIEQTAYGIFNDLLTVIENKEEIKIKTK